MALPTTVDNDQVLQYTKDRDKEKLPERQHMTDINATQAIILAVLHDTEAPGSHVESEARKLAGHWNVTRSQVYRELPVLTVAGFLVKLDPDPDNRWAEPYRITEQGRAAFLDWFLNKKLSHIVRDPWILRQRLAEYAGIPDTEKRVLAMDALAATEAELLREQAKPTPDPLLLARHQAAIAWFMGSLS